MLCLRFRIDDNFYAFEYDAIREVVPCVSVTSIAGAPACVPGCINYRGRVVPVVDLSMLISGRPASAAMGTRIAVVDYRDGRLLGLIMENVNDAVELDRAAGQNCGVKTAHEFLEDIFISDQERDMLRLVNTDKILTDDLKELLFPD